MEMPMYYGSGTVGGRDVDLFHALAEFPAMPWCMSAPPFLTSDGTSFPMAAAAPYSHDHDSVGGYSSAMMLREDVTTGFLPMTMPPSFASDDLDTSYNLPPFPADLATAGLDDSLLMQPFTDIDLDAFANVEPKIEPTEPLDLDTAMVPLGQDFGEPPMAAMDRLQQNNDAALGVRQVVDDPLDDDEESVDVVAMGYGEAVVRYAGETEAPPPRAKRSSVGSGAAASVKSLDHIGFQELRNYFYMPITKAAREMNVGLTVLKKRCRELGVARWPHRKMKSLRSLILNMQEMGKGAMSAAEVQQELELLERYCARMEENPAIELTERTKKLRQACFKENYKRRRASADSLLDHCYGDFGHQEMSRMISRNSNVSTSEFFGY